MSSLLPAPPNPDWTGSLASVGRRSAWVPLSSLAGPAHSRRPGRLGLMCRARSWAWHTGLAATWALYLLAGSALLRVFGKTCPLSGRQPLHSPNGRTCHALWLLPSPSALPSATQVPGPAEAFERTSLESESSSTSARPLSSFPSFFFPSFFHMVPAWLHPMTLRQ